MSRSCKALEPTSRKEAVEADGPSLAGSRLLVTAGPEHVPHRSEDRDDEEEHGGANVTG
jgi:hypothetical protein